VAVLLEGSAVTGLKFLATVALLDRSVTDADFGNGPALTGAL